MSESLNMPKSVHWSEKLAELYYAPPLSPEKIKVVCAFAFEDEDQVIVDGKVAPAVLDRIIGAIDEYGRCDLKAHILKLQCHYGVTPEGIAEVLPKLWEWADNEQYILDKHIEWLNVKLKGIFMEAMNAIANTRNIVVRANVPRRWSQLGHKHILGVSVTYYDHNEFQFMTDPKYGRFIAVQDD